MSECGTNIVDCLKSRGINPIATASSNTSVGDPMNALVYNKEAMFHSNIESDLWWKVDFKRIVTIHSYQIETYNYCAHIRTWNVSVSNDNRHWRVVDYQPEDGFPNGRNYTMQRISSSRYLRVNKIKDSKCIYSFAFLYIKFFGSIQGVLPEKRCTQNRKIQINNSIFYIILLAFS